jgi:hypothetical protein
MTGSNPTTDRSKPGTKRHCDRQKRHSISAVITPASTHDVKAVTNVMDNVVVNKPRPASPALSAKSRTTRQHLCLDRAYTSKTVEQEIFKRDYVPHIPYKRKRGQQQNVKTWKKPAIM